MTENTATDTGLNTGKFQFEIKGSATSQQMTVTFTNNSKVWVKPIASGGATEPNRFVKSFSRASHQTG